MSYAATALAKGHGILFGKFASTELRGIDPVTYMALRKSTEIMIPSHKILRTNEARTVEANYFIRVKRALGVGRSSTPSYAVGGALTLTPSFTTNNDGFLITMKTGGNNILKYEATMAYNLENMFKNFADSYEASSTTYIFNNRSAVNNGTADVTWNAANTTTEISDASALQRAILITESNMAQNYYGGMPLTLFCDTIAWNKFAFLRAQGATNATNTSFQFGNKTFIHSLYLNAKAVALGYTKGYWICAADGTYGLLDWIPTQNQQGADHGFAEWLTVINPIDGVEYSAYKYGQPLDGTANGGYTQDWTDNWEFSLDTSPVLAPTDQFGAGETVLQAFGLI